MSTNYPQQIRDLKKQIEYRNRKYQELKKKYESYKNRVREQKKKTAKEDEEKRLIEWFFFTFGVSITPLLAHWFVALTQNRVPPSMSALDYFTIDGQLLIVSAAMLGPAIGDLFKNSTKTEKIKLNLGGIAVLLWIFTVLTNVLIIPGQTSNYALSTNVSIGIFSASFLIGFYCKLR